jgi:ABC-type transport system substrate-binding protein
MSKKIAILSGLGVPLFIAIFLVGKSVRDNRPSVREVHRSYLEIPVQSVDPLRATSTDAQLIVNNAFDGLVSFSPTDGIQPQLAEKWIVSADGKSILFHLQRNARFHDSVPVDAHAVVQSLTRLLKTPSYFQTHYHSIVGATAVSSSEVRVDLRTRADSVFFLLAGVAAKVVRVEKRRIIGVGPYVPQLSTGEVVLTRDPHYYGRLPPTAHLIFSVLSQTAGIERARQGLLHDLAFIPLDGDEIHRKDGTWKVQPMWATWVIGFDQRVPPFDRRDVREELARHLRSRDFIERIYPGQEEALGIIPLGLPGYLDPQEFRRLSEGDIPGQSPSPARIEILIPDNIKKRQRIEDWIRTSMLRSPLKVSTRAVPFDAMIRDYAKGKQGAYLLSINAEYPDPGFLFRALRSNSLSNFLGIRDPELDREIDNLETAFTVEKRAKAMRELNLKLVEQTASINLMHVRHRAWVRNCVSGLQTSPVSEGYFNYRELVNRCPE